MKHLGRLVRGLYFEDMPLGTSWETAGRTIFEADVNAFVNLTWFTEELFTNRHRTGNAISGKPVPASLIFTMAEGLVLPSLEGTGLAFLHSEMNVEKATETGDTISVKCEVIEARLTSKRDRGLVRTRNTVFNSAREPVMVYQPLRLVRCRAPVAPAQ
jgi:acyl dehydratase